MGVGRPLPDRGSDRYQGRPRPTDCNKVTQKGSNAKRVMRVQISPSVTQRTAPLPSVNTTLLSTMSTRSLGLLKFTASDLSHSAPTDRLGRDFHPRHLGRRVTGSRHKSCSCELAAARPGASRSRVPRRKSNLQHVILSERKPLHRIGKEETITLDTLETLLVFHSFDFSYTYLECIVVSLVRFIEYSAVAAMSSGLFLCLMYRCAVGLCTRGTPTHVPSMSSSTTSRTAAPSRTLST